MKNNHDLIEANDLSKDSFGGTELMLRRIYDGTIPRDILEQFQIIPTRVRELKGDKFRIYYLHDLVEDPEVQKALANEAHRQFHAVVCVSNWQAQRTIEYLNVPWSKTVVMQNAIEPIKLPEKKNNDTIRLIYHTTPHRGLQILLPVFDKLVEKHRKEGRNLHLDLYSSFAIYGWQQRDEQFKELFKFADDHPDITNHGFKPQEVVRKALAESHIFAFPSIWKETSCLCLMEAMSAALICVHPNYASLYETAANWTHMYNYTEDMNAHAELFYGMLDDAIKNALDESVQQRNKMQSVYANSFYNWSIRTKQWDALLRNIIATNPAKEVPPEQFVYNY